MPPPRSILGAMKNYQLRTQLIHGQFRSKKWDYGHHVVPPMTASATYRLGRRRVARRAFQIRLRPRSDPSREVPIYIYDRLDEPTRGMLEDNLAKAEGGEMRVAFASGMAAISAALGVLANGRANRRPPARSTAAPTRC